MTRTITFTDAEITALRQSVMSREDALQDRLAEVRSRDSHDEEWAKQIAASINTLNGLFGKLAA